MKWGALRMGHQEWVIRDGGMEDMVIKGGSIRDEDTNNGTSMMWLLDMRT